MSTTLHKTNSLAFRIIEDEHMKITRVWYCNDYDNSRTLMDCYPWSYWGRQGAWEAAGKAARKLSNEVLT